MENGILRFHMAWAVHLSICILCALLRLFLSLLTLHSVSVIDVPLTLQKGVTYLLSMSMDKKKIGRSINTHSKSARQACAALHILLHKCSLDTSSPLFENKEIYYICNKNLLSKKQLYYT